VRLGIRVGVSEKGASKGRPENERSRGWPNGLALLEALAAKPKSSAYGGLTVFTLGPTADAWRSASC
jgi:hypothetical protein